MKTLATATPRMLNVMCNVAAFVNAARHADYEPEMVAGILYYHPVTVAEAMHRLGLIDRRSFERRAMPDAQFAGSNDRRTKDRRSEPLSWGSFF